MVKLSLTDFINFFPFFLEMRTVSTLFKLIRKKDDLLNLKQNGYGQVSDLETLLIVEIRESPREALFISLVSDVKIIVIVDVPSMAKVLLSPIFSNLHNLGTKRDTNEYEMNSIDICSFYRLHGTLFFCLLYTSPSPRD